MGLGERKILPVWTLRDFLTQNQVTRSFPSRSVISLAVLTVALTYSYALDGFGVVPVVDWLNWQTDSEAIVVNRFLFDQLGSGQSNLGLILEFSADGKEVLTYNSMIGGYALILSQIWNLLGLDELSLLHLMQSVLMAFSVVVTFALLRRHVNQQFAWAWLVGMALSPWITLAGRNLYWSPWLWLLPTIFALLLAAASTGRRRTFLRLGVLSAFAFKYWATGYELFTSITLLAASMPLLVWSFGPRKSRELKRQLVNATFVCGASLASLVGTLLLHAYLLAGNLGVGLVQIWREAVLRRTYGSPEDFGPQYVAGLQATPFEVVWKYIYSDWSTNFLALGWDRDGSFVQFAVGRLGFPLLVVSAFVVVVIRVSYQHHSWVRDSVLLACGFVVAASWFVAAKGHSYVHTHILFFLWYLLFVPALIFVVADFCRSGFKRSLRRLKGNRHHKPDLTKT